MILDCPYADAKYMFGVKLVKISYTVRGLDTRAAVGLADIF